MSGNDKVISDYAKKVVSWEWLENFAKNNFQFCKSMEQFLDEAKAAWVTEMQKRMRSGVFYGRET